MLNKYINKLFKIAKVHINSEIKILKRPKSFQILNYQFNNINVKKHTNLYNDILIDGTWENANYWIRLKLILKALSLEDSIKTGLLGKYQRRSAKSAFKNFNFANIYDTQSINYNKVKNEKLAINLIKNSRDQKDILNWDLPENVPGKFLYDSLLKVLQTPTIDLKNPDLVNLVAQSLHQIEIAKEVFSDNKYSLYICSHTLGIIYGSFAWMAVKNNVDVICLYGDYGAARFWKINKLFQLKETGLSYPSKKEFSVSDLKSKKFIDIGKKHLFKRLNGESNDISGDAAFKNTNSIDRDKILKYFNWPKNKKIVTVYTHNWADYPHSSSVKNYVDFKEWTDITIEIARQNTNVLWLFKEHPIIYRYNYKKENTISYIINQINDYHINVVPNGWDGKAVMDSTDFAITVNGSIAFEFSGLGKPILIADYGLYGEYGFGLIANSANEYKNLLKSSWWEKIDLEKSRLNALKFIGMYQCLPSWQKTLIYADDSKGDLIYHNLERFLIKNKVSIKNEIYCLRKWYKSKNEKYHIFKMLNSEKFMLGNIIND